MLPNHLKTNPVCLPDRHRMWPVSTLVPLPTDFESHVFQREQGSANGKSKRESDFIAGRHAAAAGLELLGFDTQVGVDENRCPIWPTGVTGSISHSCNFAWAAVARNTDYPSIGIDTEPIVDQTTMQQIGSQILSENELATVQQNSRLSRPQGFTLVFSAKESLYKCIYQIDGQFYDFHQACVTSFNEMTIQLTLTSTHPSIQFAGQSFLIYYSVNAKDVFTACWLESREVG